MVKQNVKNKWDKTIKQNVKNTWEKILKTIDETNSENAYDNIVSFYQLTSELYAQLNGIKKIPVQEPTKPSYLTKVFQPQKAIERQKKTLKARELKEKKDDFCAFVARIPYMPKYGYIRSENGEQITKDNVLSCGAIGYELSPISKFESLKDSDPNAYHTIANQIVDFIKRSKSSFNNVSVDWF